MSEANNGGQAFPKTGSWHPDSPHGSDSDDCDGMTLRQYYAAHAPFTLKDARERGGMDGAIPTLVKMRFEYADMMLEAERGEG